MKIKVLMCNCKGLCDSFKQTDFNTLPFQVESELDVAYVALHPQTCGPGGNQVLADIMRSADADTWIVSAACAPEAQDKLFRRLMRQTGFPPERFVPVDIRMTDNEGVVQRIREKVEQLLQRESEKELTPEDLMGACECSQLPAEKEK
jgi:heterodisulfide reductase subunit A-like polyferredoxin